MSIKFYNSTLEIIMNDNCNLNCTYCSHGSPLIKNGYTMSHERIKAISTFFSEYVFDALKISGGEPTLHPEFADISKNIRRLFCANSYQLATNGARLEKYLEEIKDYDRVEFSLYAGYNDNIFYKIKELSVPNIIHIDRQDEKYIFDHTDQKNPEEFNKAYFCPYVSVLKICHDRLGPCCLAFANCVRNKELDYNDASIPIDEHWAEKIEPLKAKMKDFCDKCYVKVLPKDNNLALSKPIKAACSVVEDQDIYSNIINLKSFGEKGLYTPIQKISSNVANRLSTKIAPFEILSSDFYAPFWMYTFFKKRSEMPDERIIYMNDIESIKKTPKEININNSHIASQFFDIPFAVTSAITVKFFFDCENKQSFFCQIQNENFESVARAICVSSDKLWEWTFSLGNSCDRIRFFITSPEIYAVHPPVKVTVTSSAQSIDFIKYHLLYKEFVVSTSKQKAEIENAKAEIENAKVELESLKEAYNAQTSSRWWKLGKKLGIVKTPQTRSIP